MGDPGRSVSLSDTFTCLGLFKSTLFSLCSIRWHVPPQACSREVSISNSTNPWLGSWHQPVGWLPLPSTKPKAKTAHAPQRWVKSSFFPPLNSSYYVLSFSPGTSTFLQVNPRFVWPATVRLSTALASLSLRSWSILHARRRTPMGTLYGMSTVRMVRSWRPQVLPKSPARPRPSTHYITVHHKNTTAPYQTAILHHTSNKKTSTGV